MSGVTTARLGFFMELTGFWTQCYRCQKPFQEGDRLALEVVMTQTEQEVAKQVSILPFEHPEDYAKPRAIVQLVHQECLKQEGIA